MANLSNINNKFIVEDSGDVGIGVTTATTKLHIGGTAPGDSIIRQDSTVSGTNWEIGERAAGKWQIFEDDGDTIVATFMSSGNVGIGTASPSRGPLHINENSSGYCQVHLTNDTSGTTSGDGLTLFTNGADAGLMQRENSYLLFGTNDTERMRIDSSGKIGVSNTNPSAFNSLGATAQIVIGNASSVSNLTMYSSSTGYGSVSFADSNSSSSSSQYSGLIQYYQANNSMAFYTASTERMRIDGSGNVGIGTTSPPSDHRLQIHNAGAAYSRFALTNSSTGVASGDGLIFQMETLNSIIKNQENGSLAFGTNGRETDLFIKSDGNVGIGTTSPGDKLNVHDSSANANLGIKITRGSQTHGLRLGVNDSHAFLWTTENQDLVFATNDSQRLTIQSGGNIGIGTTSPNEKLQVAGNIHAYAPSGIDAGLFASTAAGSTTIAIRSSGVTHFNGGNVGIGTNSPSVLLDARLSGTTGKVAEFHNSVGYGIGFTVESDGGVNTINSESNQALAFATNGAANKRMTITTGGNVGIGTTSPDITGFGYRTLTVVGGTSAGYAGVLELGSPTTNANGQNLGIIAFMDGSTRNAQIDVTRASSTSTSNMQFYTNGGSGIEERMRITAAGNVGIDINPDGYGKLTVGGTSSLPILALRSSSGKVRLGFYEGGTGRFYIDSLNGSDGLAFVDGNGSSERMRIDSSGNVGINETSPDAKLHVMGTTGLPATSGTAFTGTMRLQVAGGYGTVMDFGAVGPATGTQWIQVTDSSNQAIQYPLLLQPNGGNVGIGTISATYKLHVKSSNNVSIFEDTSDAAGATFIVFNRPGVFSMGSITRNGAANSVSYNTGSDYRLKEDLKDFNALDLVNNITAYDYKWKNTEQRDYGFVAHELQQTLPNVVVGEKDAEEMQGVDYSKLTPILLKAIQELKAEIEILKNK